MPLYNVHLFPVCRVKVYNVEAGSMKEAAVKAMDQVNLYRLYPDHTTDSDPDDSISIKAGWNEEIDGCLVDIVGAPDTDGSMFFDEDFNEQHLFPPLESEGSGI